MTAKTEQAAIDLGALASMDAAELLTFAFERYGNRLAIGTSLQKSGVIMIDMAHRLGLPIRVFFIDTLMNNPETYELIEEVQDRYSITIERFSPDPEDVESLYKSVGQYAHFLARPSCCRVRKWLPLQRALATLDGWIAGLRADQSDHRNDTAAKVAWAADEHGRAILKFNPLFDWTDEDVDAYTRDNALPMNRLYDYVSAYGERYAVIGCACCHIPVRDGLPARTGKFPWEQSKKECGLHEDGGGI